MDLPPKNQQPRKRGRPPKARENMLETRELLIRAGLEVLTEKGFSATGIDEILRRVNVPKGSFYHYFESKEAFGLILIDAYANFFAKKLDSHFLNEQHRPLARIQCFIEDAKANMARFHFKRGCLIGNLGQEMGNLPESYKERLNAVFKDWQKRTASCFQQAQDLDELPSSIDCDELAAFFWIGWEGAVLRAKLDRTSRPLDLYANYFFLGLPRLT